ncbi:MAG: hypothetical protein ACK5RL_05875 [Acidimicrobiales bacterium]
MVSARRSGLQQLLGRDAEPSLPRVRRFITETALAAIADSFAAEAAVIARRDSVGPASVVLRVPPSWAETPELAFEAYGRLWGLLDDVAAAGDAAGPVPGGHRRQQLGQIGRYQVWFGAQQASGSHLAAAVARTQPFTPDETATLTRLVRSVAVAVGVERRPFDRGIVTRLVVDPPGRSRSPGFAVARLTLKRHGRSRSAEARASTVELATAMATASACGHDGTVRFAGRTELDGSLVTLVLMSDRWGSPLLGLAVSAADDQLGPVEAVWSAVSMADG